MGRLRSGQDGSALVEVAIALPVLLLVFFGTVDFARVLYLGFALNNAARAGAQYGATSLSHSADRDGIVATANLASPTLSNISVDLTDQLSCYCTTDDAVLTPAACTDTCSGGEHLSVFVTVTTRQTFNRVTPFPGIPSGFLITRAARMRVAN